MFNSKRQDRIDGPVPRSPTGAPGSRRDLEIPDNFPLENFVTEVSHDDDMFDVSEHYISVGLSALSIFEHAIARGYLNEGNVGEILDLPCGFGRVSRVLRARFPRAGLTVCDLNRAGVDFCAANFSGIPVSSSKDFDELVFDRSFDLIWVGSLITHLDMRHTIKLLRRITCFLAPAGLLIVSSSGRIGSHRLGAGAYNIDPTGILRVLSDYYTVGYAFQPYPNTPDYGDTLISQEWLENYFENENMVILEFKDGAWDNCQDVSFVKAPTGV